MTKIEEILEKYENKTDHYADQEWDEQDLIDAMQEYGDYCSKLAIRNTRYKAIEIVNEHLGDSHMFSDFNQNITRDIQNIDNKDIIPPHE